MGRPTGTQTVQLTHVRWMSIRHTTVGGPTNFLSLVGLIGPTFLPKLTQLRRTIRSIFDFGARPHPCQPPSERSPSAAPSHYTLDDILLTQHYTLPVKLPSSFCASGWGVRRLTHSELSKAHGFPWTLAMQNEVDPLLFTFPPIQILDAITDGYLSEVQLALWDIAPSQVTAADVATALIPTPLDDQSWIPALQRFLPHSWIDPSLITTKAIKSDNASGPSHLWDLRLTLLFPPLVVFSHVNGGGCSGDSAFVC
jgi:hypothetical protein